MLMQVLLATLTGKWPRVQPRARSCDYIFDLSWYGASRTTKDC